MIPHLYIKLALSYCVTADPEHLFSSATWGSEKRKKGTEWLEENGIIDITQKGLIITDRGRAWMNAIVSMPLPTLSYIVRRSEFEYTPDYDCFDESPEPEDEKESA